MGLECIITQAIHKSSQGSCETGQKQTRVFTVIKVNSGLPLGIALLLRHVAAAFSSHFYGLKPSVSNLQTSPFLKGRGKKCKSKLACCTPPPTLTCPLLCSCPTLNLWMINLPTEAVRGEDPHAGGTPCVLHDTSCLCSQGYKE